MKAGPRIVAGAWRGRVLRVPEGQATRPTSIRLRQSLFDLLMHATWFGRARMEGAAVADLFAGTGALGLEALSRGAGSCVFVEREASALVALRANVAACGARATVRAADATGALPAGAACDLMFLDPPYGMGAIPLALAAAARAGWLTPETIVAAEAEVDAPPVSGQCLARRRHGAGAVAIYTGVIGSAAAVR